VGGLMRLPRWMEDRLEVVGVLLVLILVML
jgi:hypothetical protein